MELSFSSPSPLPLHGEIAKALPVVMLETKKLLLSVGDVVGLELLATTLADNYKATVLPNYLGKPSKKKTLNL